MKRSKRYQNIETLVGSQRVFGFDEAIATLKKSATTSFDETAEIIFNLGIKASQVTVRGTCSLPHGTGKTVRILAFAKGANQVEATEAGADYVGGEDIAKKIKDGWLEFDKVVATPDMMSVVGKLGKILGPRGLMPSPKTGTVTRDVGKIIAELKKGMVEFRSDRQGLIHSIFGKASFEEGSLKENLTTIIRSVSEHRPEEGVKGNYITKVSIASTMGPGLELDLSEIMAVTEQAN